MKNMDKVLIVEDNEVNRKLLCRILGETYETLEADTGKKALEILKESFRNVVAIILDLSMPEMDGFTFMKEIVNYSEYKNIPIIVETAQQDLKVEKRCLDLGAWDFFSKPFHEDILLLKIKNVVERFRLLQNENDSVTGLPGRNRFYRETRQLLNEHKKDTNWLIWFDIDRFKMFNTFYGYYEGDLFLQYIAQRIKKLQSEYVCTIGNTGADKFVLCISEQNMDDIVPKIEDMIMDYKSNFYLKPSIGIYKIEDTEQNISQMCDCAELAASSCKNNVMKKSAYYDGQMKDQLLKEQLITNEMYQAMKEKQFIVYLQPKYNLKNNMPQGAEALVRWKHPTKGLISPGVFIPVFEKNGFIGQLDVYMWEQVCQLLRKWIDEGKNPSPISVNVSRVNLYNPHIAELIIEMVKKYDVPIEKFHIEITESALMNNQSIMQNTIKKLRQAGFRIYMDDFGNGYSSLNVLKDLDLDVLKIDMKFMPTSTSNGKGEKILSSVIRMAKWIEMPVIAEGVETLEQVNFLKSMGCEFVQGYYFAKPMPVSEYEKLMEENAFQKEKIVTNNEIAGRNLIDDLVKTNSSLALVLEKIAMPVCSFLYDENRIELLRSNKCFRDTLEEFTIHDLNENPQFSFIKRKMNETIHTEKKVHYEYSIEQNENIRKYYDVQFQVMAKVEKEYIIFAVFKEITQEKQLENELGKYVLINPIERKEKPYLLIVDDSEVSRAVIQSNFADEFVVLEAENGEIGLEMLRHYKNKIEVILLDLYMPVLDGHLFLEEKNFDKSIAEIPVIIISSEGDEYQQVDMLKMGAKDYITKPFISNIVKQKVRNVVEYHLEHKLVHYNSVLKG